MTALQILAFAALGIVAGLLALVVSDLFQTRHAILRNFPLVGHFRYWLEAVGPELRQPFGESHIRLPPSCPLDRYLLACL